MRLAARLAQLPAVLAAALLLPGAAQARQGEPSFTALGAGRPLAAVQRLTVPERDVPALLAQADRRSVEDGAPAAFADPVPVAVTPETHGSWEALPGGDRLWRLVIDAPGATDLNLGFVRYRLPPGAMLHCGNPDENYWEGPYTSDDNDRSGQLWLPVVPGDHAVLELFVPAQVKHEPELTLAQIGYGFRDWFHRIPDLLRQGNCNIDVTCPEADPWHDDVESVGVYQVNGQWTCTGTMVMNTNGDFRPYFLTASHCDVGPENAASVVVYWNFESPSCDSLGGGSLAQNQTGATFRASYAGSDFCLLELNADPDPAWGVYYAGWDRSGTPAPTSVGIHHPNTDEKAISFNDNPVTATSYLLAPSPGDATHWRIDAWESGTTEPGSSGSGLWNPEHRIIGQLHGGYASCINPAAGDWYGRLDVSWTGGGSASTRLRDWLDPGSTGAWAMDGAYPAGLGSVKVESHASIDDCPGAPANVNGLWEAGETVTLAVDVSAVGFAQTGITGVLSSTTPGVTILDDTATWPDLSPGVAATSDAPHFLVQLDPGMTCDGQADFQLTLSTPTTGPFVYGFRHDIGSATVPSGLPVPIPDEGGGALQHPFAVADDLVLTDVNVNLEIRHSWVGDLKVELRSPAGTIVTLLDRPGDPADLSGCDDADMIVTFDDASTYDLESHCAGTNPWYSGTAAPFSPLSAFLGESTQGTWTLLVSDRTAGDTGSLVSWSLDTTPPINGVCTPCLAGTGAPGPVGTAPAAFGLRPSRPNPFHDRTELHYALDRGGPVTLRIYDVGGRLVTTLVDRAMPAGAGVAVWDGRDLARREVASGIYFLRLATPDGRADTKRIHLIR